MNQSRDPEILNPFPTTPIVATAHSASAFDSYEQLDRANQTNYQESHLRKLLGTLLNSAPYYQFAHEAVRPLTLPGNTDFFTQFSELPVLTPGLFKANIPPENEQLLDPSWRNHAHTCFQSGGTTGRPKTSIFSYKELHRLKHGNSRGFYASGLRASDKVANLFAVGGLYMTFIHIQEMLEHYGCSNYPISNATAPDAAADLIRTFQINTLTGITSVILDVLRVSREQGNPLQIEKIFFGGEHLYDHDRRILTEIHGAKIIRAPGYGTVETWYLGYQCSDCAPGVFHEHSDQMLLEIVDPETHRPVPMGQEGIVLATVFERELMPILRYRVGDLARWIDEPGCDCGRTTRRFQLLGRGDDQLRIGYDTMDLSLLEKASQLPYIQQHLIIGAFQMEKQRHNERDEWIVRYEVDQFEKIASSIWPELSQRIITYFEQQKPNLASMIRRGQVHPIRIEWKPSGSLTRNVRTGKLPRTIDLRLN